MTIEPGSTVMLKSGSPTMTVEEMGEHNDARCTWFFGNELRREWFAMAALRLAPPSPQPQRPVQRSNGAVPQQQRPQQQQRPEGK
ncbi:MAG: YodC family protein [Planktomarina sp.]